MQVQLRFNIDGAVHFWRDNQIFCMCSIRAIIVDIAQESGGFSPQTWPATGKAAVAEESGHLGAYEAGPRLTLVTPIS